MALELSIHLEQYPEDMPLSISGLGVVPNGGSAELTEEQELGFVAANGMSVREAVSEQTGVSVSGTAFVPDSKVEEVAPEDESLTGQSTRIADVGDVGTEDSEGKVITLPDEPDEPVTEVDEGGTD